jgi:16S rRNA (guanine966-N2)-methyltransferase
MIENSRRTLAVLRENLQTLGISSSVRLLSRDAVVALRQLEEEANEKPVATDDARRASSKEEQDDGKFDTVFFDPPYASELYARVLNQLASGPLLSEDAIVVVESHAKRPPKAEYGNLQRYREVKQGESALAFYRLA